MDRLDYALHYALEWGWAVIPLHSIAAGFCTCGNPQCRSAGKHPRTARGVHDATRDATQIRKWWTTWPDANIGVATGPVSGIVVLDVDPRHGGDRSMRDLFPDEPITIVQRTGSGGLHYFFRYPPGATIRNSAGRLAPGLDIRGEGGYVVVPPSNHISGRYCWLTEEGELAPLPPPLMALLVSPNGHNGERTLVATSPAPVPDVVPEGARNQTLTSLAGTMRRRGFSEAAIAAALLAENERICRPPLPEGEVRRIARSVARYDAPDFPIVDEQTSFDRVVSTLGEFLARPRERGELIACELRRREVGMIVSETNQGKSTLARNIAVSLCAGYGFGSLAPRPPQPRRVLLIDSESSADRLSEDLATMISAFTPEDQERVRENLRIINEAEWRGEMFSLTRHIDELNAYLLRSPVDLVIVDTITANFDLHNENDNAEVSRRAMKPLLRLARVADCAVLTIHHKGKPKLEEGLTRNKVHAPRGASAWGGYAASIYTLETDERDPEAITIYCAKRKSGPQYDLHFRLHRESRWLEEIRAPVQRSSYDMLIELLERSPQPLTLRELRAYFKDAISPRTLDRLLALGVANGRITKTGRGEYVIAKVWIGKEP